MPNVEEFVYKLYPFRSGNRAWVLVLLQAYSLCVVTTVVLGALLNYAEGEDWFEATRGMKIRAYGNSSFDECCWFIFTTLHGIGFGEFMPQHSAGHLIAMATVSLSYWFSILMMAIVMLSQLPGLKSPGFFKVMRQIGSATWPSYAIYLTITFLIGCTVGDNVSKAPVGTGHNDWATGVYWLWCVMHRAPYGDIWPNDPWSRVVAASAAVLSYLYPPFCLALIAVRKPTQEEHDELVEHMNQHPDESWGRGYVVPNGVREVQMT
eukprot:TRINITY_DN23305_c0_g1_i1.p1 TRINITY_DN23305_c0_g1~~TRINITY_DN23305_c0_g1_i1.p1  ORF type:complete len:264 (+),score=31.40 TRINITY_DN23305_c0_g1_i1:85-876(+)